MLQHATGHHTDRSLFHKRFEYFPQCHRHPCPSFTGSLLLARGTKLPKNSSTLEGRTLNAPSAARAVAPPGVVAVGQSTPCPDPDMVACVSTTYTRSSRRYAPPQSR